MTCFQCARETQHVGTSPAGADCYQCPACDHLQFVAPRAEFKGWQPGFEELPPVALYNVVGGQHDGFTVGAETLASFGQRLVRSGSWYYSAIELDNYSRDRLDGEQLGYEAIEILTAAGRPAVMQP